ncbi:hypothetical protein [Streptomyces sp. ST2-7A]|uniref:HD domain-containing protein n=1 Tax=Streptomyces sp. ST2-7A TaxID=2907214 RepID=UPI001F3B5E90|nr:hypothetical protein [Streptomyces sp. ST2-7A]MCE7080180.1 hypothetical protein [Streptomyces sp. ST2-7A]
MCAAPGSPVGRTGAPVRSPLTPVPGTTGPGTTGDYAPPPETRLARLLGDRPEVTARTRALLARWAEPARHYHTTDHLWAVLRRLDLLTGHADDPVAVELAAWYHDAVYEPGAPDNEERSARLAEEELPALGIPADRIAEVARLVRLTDGHRTAPGDTNGEALCDADLGVLGGPPEEYARYTAAVRMEYAAVPADAFRAGRAAVLRDLLALPRLYRTPYGTAHWEATARYNLRAELELLTA